MECLGIDERWWTSLNSWPFSACGLSNFHTRYLPKAVRLLRSESVMSESTRGSTWIQSSLPYRDPLPPSQKVFGPSKPTSQGFKECPFSLSQRVFGSNHAWNIGCLKRWHSGYPWLSTFPTGRLAPNSFQTPSLSTTIDLTYSFDRTTMVLLRILHLLHDKTRSTIFFWSWRLRIWLWVKTRISPETAGRVRNIQVKNPSKQSCCCHSGDRVRNVCFFFDKIIIIIFRITMMINNTFYTAVWLFLMEYHQSEDQK